MKRIAMLIILLLAACSGGSSGSDPAKTVQSYLQAKIAGDEAALRGLLCSDMEADLPREAHAFASVSSVTLDGVLCTYNADASTVTCDGAIVAEYGAENTRFPLSTYRVVQEDGEWRWCGEAG